MNPETGELPKIITHFQGLETEQLAHWKKVQREKARKFLRTKRSEKLFKEILMLLQRSAATPWARERLSLLSPTSDFRELAMNRELVEKSMDSIRDLNNERLKEIKILLGRIDIPEEPVPRYDGSMGIVAENDEIYTTLIDGGINRWCPIYTPVSLNPDSDLILYVYEIGNLDIHGDNVLMIPMNSTKESIIPESVLTFFRHNREVFLAAREIQQLRGEETLLDTVLELLDMEPPEECVDLKKEGIDALEVANNHFSDAVKGLRIEGGAILQLLGSETPGTIKTRLNEAEREGVKHFHERTGFHLCLNTAVFPFTLDNEELEKSVTAQRSMRKKQEFEEWTKRARELGRLKDQVIREIQSLLEFDLRSAIASFVRNHSLHFPSIAPEGEEIILTRASHLKLVNHKECVKVDYHLGGQDNVVILTGANSGGKTTLLETIAQTFILAKMGFPVCCEEAYLPDIEELYFHSRKAAMNAGAFESFLKSFIPVVKRGKRKLILADELEAITELDAGAKIIATILSRVKESDSFAVVVSHMSQEIGETLDVRIDGIEARGLDENLDLIIDRNPRIGYRARSTPELIVQRLYTLAKGEEREIYRDILSSFHVIESSIEGGDESG